MISDDAELDAALSQNVEDGLVEIFGVDEDGELLFRLTEMGERRVQEIAERQGFDLTKAQGMSLPEFWKAMGF